MLCPGGKTMMGGENNNKDVILLPKELFTKAVNIKLQECIQDHKVRPTDNQPFVTKSGRTLYQPNYGTPKDWKDDNSILLYQDKVYIPPNDGLC